MSARHESSDTGADYRSDIQSLVRAWKLAGPLKTRVAAGVWLRFAQSMALGLSFGVVIAVTTGLMQGRPLNSSWILQASGFMAFSFVGQIVFGYLSVRASWLSSYEVAGHIRLQLLEQLSRLPLGFHKGRQTGDTITVLTTDMQMLEGFFSDGLPRIAQALGLPVAVFIVLLTQDWVSAVVAATAAALAVPVFVGSSRHLAKLGIRRQDLQAEAAARAIETVRGLPVIRAFNQMQKGQERYRRAIDDLRDMSISMVVQLSLPMACFGMIVMLGTALVIWVTGVRSTEGSIDASIAVTSLILVFAMYRPLLTLLEVMESIRIADASLCRIDRILTAKPLVQGPVHVPDGFEIRFDRVSFRYAEAKPLLCNLTLSIPERSMTAIVGPSGAGKSTLLSLLARFWDCDSGAITIGGVGLANIGEKGLCDLVSMVFQDAYLFSGTIRENIALAKPAASEAEIEAAARKAQAHAFISRLPEGYDTEVGEGGAALSGGERQRIAIARAILKDAPIVLMDEITAALDTTTERKIQIALSQLVSGRTLVVVAHKLSTVKSADQIIVLDNGRIVECGRHDELVQRNGVYARFWH